MVVNTDLKNLFSTGAFNFDIYNFNKSIDKELLRVFSNFFVKNLIIKKPMEMLNFTHSMEK
ncbi:protein of unknown function [[Clostridium] ultunense Esp]|uniref:Uncharacterized protein n=1 Tax=[Clostridium] ultunense Esp TaxID=1288971 RepID=A0A1M4PLM3_9FIRM|nr:protein of unknown function [[Clostridium] ultunense Esp]